jgi:hypothetical protein
LQVSYPMEMPGGDFSDTFGHEVCEYLRNSCESRNSQQLRLVAYPIRLSSVFTHSKTSM